jgi:hypothetical protein
MFLKLICSNKEAFGASHRDTQSAGSVLPETPENFILRMKQELGTNKDSYWEKGDIRQWKFSEGRGLTLLSFGARA